MNALTLVEPLSYKKPNFSIGMQIQLIMKQGRLYHFTH